MDSLLNSREAAKRLQVCLPVFYRLVNEGRVKTVTPRNRLKARPRRLLFAVSEIERVASENLETLAA